MGLDPSAAAQGHVTACEVHECFPLLLLVARWGLLQLTGLQISFLPRGKIQGHTTRALAPHKTAKRTEGYTESQSKVYIHSEGRSQTQKI